MSLATRLAFVPRFRNMRLALLLALLPACSQTPPPRLITFAALNMAGGADAKYSTPEARDAQRALVAELAPDVLALEEVNRGPAGNADAEIVPPGGALEFLKCAAFESADTGISLWVHPRLQLLAPWPVGLEYSAWVDDRLAADVWPRSSLCGVVRDGERDIVVCAVHLTASARWQDGSPAPAAPIRARQLAETASFDPDVIIGDFNALTDEIGETLAPLGYAPATHGELVSVWWKLKGEGRMVPTRGASDHPGAAVAVARL